MMNISVGEKLDPFFVKLDQESKKLRNAAKDFASFLSASKFALSIKPAMIKALEDIYSSRIDKIDIAIDNLKKLFLKASVELDDMKKPDASEELEKEADTFIQKNSTLVDEAGKLVAIAFDLNKQ